MEAWAVMWDTDSYTRFLPQKMRMRRKRRKMTKMRITIMDILMTIHTPMDTPTPTGTLTHTVVRPRQIMGILTRLVVTRSARRRPPLPPPRLVPRNRLSSIQTDLRKSPSLSLPPNHRKNMRCSHVVVAALFCFRPCLRIRNEIESCCFVLFWLFGFCCHKKKKKNTRMIHKSFIPSTSVGKKGVLVRGGGAL
jgi:hypothetical protein